MNFTDQGPKRLSAIAAVRHVSPPSMILNLRTGLPGRDASATISDGPEELLFAVRDLIERWRRQDHTAEISNPTCLWDSLAWILLAIGAVVRERFFMNKKRVAFI